MKQKKTKPSSLIKKISKQKLAVRTEYEGIAVSHMQFLSYHLKCTLAEAQQYAVIAVAEEILSRELAKRSKQSSQPTPVQGDQPEPKTGDHPGDGAVGTDGGMVGGCDGIDIPGPG